ncbi:unnamed protein product [Paramecium sonneborni]|uniref:Uncharacterized protein n=1 Tax=Paramecium sonneborni TaxID=65129 RepID=A0A8S1RNZ2_9CILI|nr:unnamed protein product [Paramecium sonneborni]
MEILHYSGSVYDDERDMVVENEFEPGFQLLYVEVDWSQHCNRYLTVSCYGSKSVQFSELQFEPSQTKQIIDNIFNGFLRVVFEILPGQSKLIQLQSIDPTKGYSFKQYISSIFK